MSLTRDERQPLGRVDLIFALALTVLTLALFMYFLRTPVNSDQLDYFYHSWRPDTLGPVHRHLRIGLIFPSWLAIQLFGYSELSYYVIPAFGALCLALGTWFIGRMLFDRSIGALASLLVIYDPWVLSEFTDLLPDYLASGLFSVAMAILLWCWRTNWFAAQAAASTTVPVMLIVGFLVGWSYLVREYVVIVFPVVIFSVLAINRRVADLIAVALGAAVCWSIELLWGLFKFGDPLVRLHAVASPRAVSKFVEMDVMDVLLQLPRLFLDRSGGMLFAFLLVYGACAGVWYAIQGDRRWQVLMFWLIGGWFFFTMVALMPIIWLGEEHIYLRMHKFRYWSLILPPAMIAGVAAIQRLATNLMERAGVSGTRNASLRAGLVVSLAVLVYATFAVLSETYSRRLWNDPNGYKEFRAFMAESENEDEIVFIGDARRSLPIYITTWNGSDKVWKGRVIEASTRRSDDIIGDPARKLVAIDLTRAEARERQGKSPKRMLRLLGHAGVKIFESSDGNVVVYQLGRKREDRP